MIKINNLSVAFDNTEVVKNVNLKINDGENLGLLVNQAQESQLWH